MLAARAQDGRGRRHSWLSAALSGRLTGSGAVFSGQSTNPFDTAAASFKAGEAAVIAKAKQDAANAAGVVVQNAVGAVSNNQATVVPKDTLVIGGVVIGALLLLAD